MKSTTVKIDEHMLKRLDSIANGLNRPRSWVIHQALERFVEYEEWFVREVKAGIRDVADGEVATDQEVREAFAKWGVDAR